MCTSSLPRPQAAHQRRPRFKLIVFLGWNTVQVKLGLKMRIEGCAFAPTRPAPQRGRVRRRRFGAPNRPTPKRRLVGSGSQFSHVDERIQPLAVERRVHPLLPVTRPLVESDRANIPHKDMQLHALRAALHRPSFRLCHQGSRQTTTPVSGSRIERHYICQASTLKMNNHESHQLTRSFSNHHNRSRPQREPPHRLQIKPKRLLKADQVQRIHSLYIRRTPRPQRPRNLCNLV